MRSDTTLLKLDLHSLQCGELRNDDEVLRAVKVLQKVPITLIWGNTHRIGKSQGVKRISFLSTRQCLLSPVGLIGSSYIPNFIRYNLLLLLFRFPQSFKLFNPRL